MAIRPPRKASRTADRSPASLQRVPAMTAGDADDAAAERATRKDAMAQVQDEALGKVEATLRAQGGLDAEDFDAVIEHLRKAVAEAQLQPGLAGPDRNTWVETLETLVQNGLLAQDEREALIRQFGEATSPLQSRDVQIALELAQRIERDGEEKAMEWLASQQPGDAKADKAVGAVAVAAVVDGKQAITRSRSRRLRGPPRAV